MKVLVVGGAGYIGSHMVKMLLEHDHEVTVLDNLSTGHRDAVSADACLVVVDLSQRGSLHSFLERNDFDAVMHFASCIDVAESVRDPAKYYNSNIANTLKLLDAMVANRIMRFVFSSSAAVYGRPDYSPIDEAHALSPINPYGFSKYAVERVLSDYESAYGLKSVTLRYFNAAGADPDGALGERHDPETHLIPLLLQAASGRRDGVEIFGRDYDTPDGTCIRDYVHVNDLCQAHLAAIERLKGGLPGDVYNLGNGSGFSVLEVIAAVEQVTGRPITVRDAPRRPGDPARLVAHAGKARAELGWYPRFPHIRDIVEHAWKWELKQSTAAAPAKTHQTLVRASLA
jgi:UDP-glucose 4-epimerase